MRVAVGADHGGFVLKEQICAWLAEWNIEYKDFGTYDDQSVDYPDYAEVVARAVANGEFDRGILVCGSGIGMSIAANKIAGIRAAVCHDTFSAKATRQDNDSNIITMGARVIGPGLAKDVLEVWLNTPFAGGRHARRVGKIAKIAKIEGQEPTKSSAKERNV